MTDHNFNLKKKKTTSVERKRKLKRKGIKRDFNWYILRPWFFSDLLSQRWVLNKNDKT